MKNGEKWIKVGERWGKVTKSGEKLEKCQKVGKSEGRWENVLFLNFGCPKITFDHSSCHFRSIHNFFFC